MAKIWYGHFDSTAEDPRLLLAEDWAKYIQCFISDGIKNGGTELQITAGGGMTLRMDEGIANIQGYIFQSEADNSGQYYEVDIDAAHPSLPRVDRVVLRLDRSIEERRIMPVIVRGTAASNPVAPALLRDDVIWDLGLATVRVDSGAINITNSKITDTRLNTSVCGLINSVLGLDPSVWREEFDSFMDELQEANDLPAYTGFDFDNLVAYPGMSTETTFPSSTTISEVKRVTNSGIKAAERTTVFNSDGSITETTVLYHEETGTQVWRRVLTTTMSGNNISEVVS